MGYSVTLVNFDGKRKLDSSLFTNAKLISIGPGGLVYDGSPIAKVEGHENWVTPNASNTYLGGYFSQAVMDTAGVVFNLAWGQVERAGGIYDWSALLRALDFCAAKNRRLIARFKWKSYYQAAASTACPSDLQPSQIRPVFLSGQAVGLAAAIEQPDVRARLKDFIAWLINVTETHPALYGYAFDESAQSCYGPSGMPVGLTGEMIDNAMRDLYTFAKNKTMKPVYPFVNYVESERPLDEANARTIELRDWCVRKGMPIAVSDTRLRENLNHFSQPIYRGMPIPVETLVTIDLSSMNYPIEIFESKMIEHARVAIGLGATKTVWCCRDGSEATSIYWPKIMNAIRATQNG